MIINNLNVSFKDNIIYDNFSLSLDNDKITCILGPSGCGKTTLLNAIAGNVKYSGTIGEIEKIGYVFQNSRLIESITVKENLEFVLEKDKYLNIDKVLEDLQILDCKNKYPRQLSGGQASRVSLARAILYNPKIILMDEPFKDLDIVLSKTLIDLFRDLIKKNNLGAIYVTHNVDEALSIADRIIVIKDSPAKIALDIEVEGEHKDLSAKNINEARAQIYSAFNN